MKRRHELPFGAEVMADGVRFRIWAPQASHVALALEGAAEALPMQHEGEGWFSLTTQAARVGSRYRYRIDGDEVPDPVSRYQPADLFGPSEVVDPCSYNWRDDAWAGRPWEEVVLYELHVGAFTARGDFGGVEERLDYLVDLGITAIELMPVADFPGARNWGYDGVLAFAPDSSYGRPEELKQLVDACHRRGLAVILDVVYNHFGPEGNYLGHYAPGFFTDRHQTPWGAAINFDQENAGPVRRFYIENALYWLEEFHFDGLRFDAVHAILDESRRHILVEIAETIRQRFAAERTIHLLLENDHNEAWLLKRDGNRPLFYDAQWNDDIHHVLHVLATGQTDGYYVDYADAPMMRLGRALAEGFSYQGETSVHRDGARRGELSAQLPPTAFVSFLQNHDQIGNNAFGNRLSFVAKPAVMRLVAAIYLVSPQIPLLFMGEEWAADQPFPFFCDFGGDLADKVRDGRRREFARFPEFRDPAARDKIPDPGAPRTFASAKLAWQALERPDHAAWYDGYRELIALRRREIVPRLRDAPGGGTYEVIGEQALVVRWRLGDGAQLTLCANFGERPAPLAHGPVGLLLFATGAVTEPHVVPPRLVAFYLADSAA